MGTEEDMSLVNEKVVGPDKCVEVKWLRHVTALTTNPRVSRVANDSLESRIASKCAPGIYAKQSHSLRKSRTSIDKSVYTLRHARRLLLESFTTFCEMLHSLPTK